MTNTQSFEIETLGFNSGDVSLWAHADIRRTNWPVVYLLNNHTEIYVGESVSASHRLQQHLKNPEKQGMQDVRVVLDDQFNKSACLDLENYLIKLFAGDGKYRVINQNGGLTDANYFDRQRYQLIFNQIVDALRREHGLFNKTIPEIVNSNLYKYSPFKSLSYDQQAAVENILDGLFEALEAGEKTESVIAGGPGTGKTIVLVYLVKLLTDIASQRQFDTEDEEHLFGEFFQSGNRELVSGARIALVVPQQSLRKTLKNVFANVPGLSQEMVVSPAEAARATLPWDVLFIDEAHRLRQPSGHSQGAVKIAREINRNLEISGDEWTEVDWFKRRAKHVFYVLDTGQTIRPGDISDSVTTSLVEKAQETGRYYYLSQQMRVAADFDYVGWIRSLLTASGEIPTPDFGEYEFLLFENLRDMRSLLREQDEKHGLSRLLAGFAWDWISKKPENKHLYDITLDGESMRWNTRDKDWVISSDAVDEVGSIHVIQGYDLNYAGVIIGPELRYNSATGQVELDRERYRDKKGKQDSKKYGLSYSDEQILSYVLNAYAVLLSRGILGTYLYVCDPGLRARFKELLGSDRIR